MNKLIVLNHKMSLLYDDLYNYIDRINNIDIDDDIIICPSSIYLESFLNNSDYAIGCQNINYSLDKNNTGEISTDQLKSMGVEYALIGHAERVEKYGESKNIVNMKLISCLEANIFPILCFGENIDEDYKEVIPKLLESYLKDINNIDFITFAYEPVYAIGTGALPSIDRIKEVVEFVSKYLEDIYHKKPSIIYGGSVDSSNIRSIMNISGLSGVMIGSISSDIKEVERIIKNI